jgi:D-lactate dehydrogenase
VASSGNIACFELEPWEETYLSTKLGGIQIVATRRALGEDSIELAEDASVVSIFIRSQVTADILKRLPAVRFIATRSTGYDHIDLSACGARGIVVENVPTYGENTLAEHTFGLILSLSRKIHQAHSRTIRGDFSLAGLRGFDVKGRKLGVVGTGHIGLHVVRIARGFGMDVLAHDVREQPLLAEVPGFQYVSLEALLEQSDIVTLHVPYAPPTHHLLDRARLGRMKRAFYDSGGHKGSDKTRGRSHR